MNVCKSYKITKGFFYPSFSDSKLTLPKCGYNLNNSHLVCIINYGKDVDKTSLPFYLQKRGANNGTNNE